MKQRYALFVLFALIIASSLTSLRSYSRTSQLVNQDMDRALALALLQTQRDVISYDTIRTFNSHLQIPELRGKATLSVHTHAHKFTAYAHCSQATIFSLSDQRPATILSLLTALWAILITHRRPQTRTVPFAIPPVAITKGETFGSLTYSEEDGTFYAADGSLVQLTPMQHQLMQMFFHSPTHSLNKTEICNALWPKKPDATQTLYTLIRRLKNVVEKHSDLKIESDRSKAYRLVCHTSHTKPIDH